jgi:hypothetical protein
LTKLLLHNPFVLTLSEVGQAKDDVIPKNVQQFWASIFCFLLPVLVLLFILPLQLEGSKKKTGKPKVLMLDRVTFS